MNTLTQRATLEKIVKEYETAPAQGNSPAEMIARTEYMLAKQMLSAAQTSGRNGLILFLDFDGVLHHENVRVSAASEPFLIAPERYRLFQHADLLAELLAPYPQVQIVLSTSWAVHYGATAAAKRLPHELQARVLGGTFQGIPMNKDEFQMLPRGAQVIADVQRRQPRDWLALDDNEEGWGGPHAAHWVQTHMYEGISDPEVLAIFKRKLQAMCAR